MKWTPVGSKGCSPPCATVSAIETRIGGRPAGEQVQTDLDQAKAKLAPHSAGAGPGRPTGAPAGHKPRGLRLARTLLPHERGLQRADLGVHAGLLLRIGPAKMLRGGQLRRRPGEGGSDRPRPLFGAPSPPSQV